MKMFTGGILDSKAMERTEAYFEQEDPNKLRANGKYKLWIRIHNDKSGNPVIILQESDCKMGNRPGSEFQQSHISGHIGKANRSLGAILDQPAL